MSRVTKCLLLGMLLLLAQASAFAWDDTGHMLVSTIAYGRLNPTAKARVDALTKTIHFSGKNYDGITVSVWMDDIKADSMHDDMKVWHYTDYPFFDSVPVDPNMKPDAENTQLLYDDSNLGVRFLYPRGWRVGAVQGKQVTLDHVRLGGGLLITLEPASKIPSAEDYLREVTAFLQKEKAKVSVLNHPTRVRPEPGQLDRFTLDVTFEKDAARLEYAVLKQTDGGATLAARLPAASAADLKTDVDRVVRSLSVTKKIAEK